MLRAGALPAHQFSACLRLWAGGSAIMTHARIVALFAITGVGATELTALRDRYVGMPTNNTANILLKAAWLTQVEGVCTLWQDGAITEAEGKAALGF
jgi:phage replication-related protein YjqB (UPF0714/DUF867 family)